MPPTTDKVWLHAGVIACSCEIQSDPRESGLGKYTDYQVYLQSKHSKLLLIFLLKIPHMAIDTPRFNTESVRILVELQ